MSSLFMTAGQDSDQPLVSREQDGPSPGRFDAIPYLVALLLLSLFAWAPLLYPGYLQVHSGFLPIFNLADLAGSGDKLHWLPGIGAPYDLLRGEGPLAYGLALLMRPLLGDLGAIKALLALSILAGGLGIFAWAGQSLNAECGMQNAESGVRAFDSVLETNLSPSQEQPGANGPGLAAQRGALLAAVIYMLWPYGLATIYVRGALAEALFIGLLPWALFLTGRARGSQAGGLKLPAAAAAGTIIVAGSLFFAQPGLAIWATPLLLVWALWPGVERMGRLLAAGSLILGALLAAGALWLLHGAAGLGHAAAPVFSDHAVYLYQFFAAGWGFGVSTAGWKEELPLQLGLAASGLAMLAVVLLFGRKAGEKPDDGKSIHDEGMEGETRMAHDGLGLTGHAAPSLLPALLLTLILLFLATNLARPFWNLLPALARPLSHPWQLLGLAGPFLALLAGSVVALERRLASFSVWAGLITLALLSSYNYLAPRFTQVQPDSAAQPAIFGQNQVVLLTAGLLISAGGETSLDASLPLTLTVNWQALQPLDFDYNIFIHAIDEAGNLISQWDGQPQRENQPYPMTGWSVGEVVSGIYRLDLPAGQSGQLRRIDLGLYNWQSGVRLPVAGADKVSLAVDAEPARKGQP